MRISDWSSDVCSSDLKGAPKNVAPRIGLGESAPAINVEKVTLVYEDGSRIVMPTEPSQITYYAHKTVLQDGRTLADLIGQVPFGPMELGEGRSETLKLNPAQRMKPRSEEHTSELQSLMRTSYAVFCLKKK